MDDIFQNPEVNYTKANAKIEFEKGNFTLAKTILKTLWDNSNKADVYLLYDYGKVLRKLDESNAFIQICEESGFNKNIMSNEFIVSSLCWCSYDVYIKTYSFEDNNGFNEFIKRAEYIKNKCIQMTADEYYKTPYVLTILKVVKVYSNRSSKNYKEIIKWLLYLDPEKLSEDVYSFQDDKGKERELASHKESYFQHMAKAFEKTQQYKECITICEIALKGIKKFHYRNNVWFKARLHFCKCMLQENIDDAISEYQKLADKEKYWFMYHKLTQICWRYNKIPVALLYASKAFMQRFEHEKMVNLMQDTAHLWQAKGNDTNAKIFFQASAYYRKRQGWNLAEELKYAVSIFEINVELKPNINEMQRISKKYIEVIEGDNKYEGKIVNLIRPHMKTGFIKPNDSDQNLYFNVNDVLDKRVLKIGDAVEYELSKNNDGKIRAVKICVKELRR